MSEKCCGVKNIKKIKLISCLSYFVWCRIRWGKLNEDAGNCGLRKFGLFGKS